MVSKGIPLLFDWFLHRYVVETLAVSQSIIKNKKGHYYLSIVEHEFVFNDPYDGTRIRVQRWNNKEFHTNYFCMCIWSEKNPTRRTNINIKFWCTVRFVSLIKKGDVLASVLQ